MGHEGFVPTVPPLVSRTESVTTSMSVSTYMGSSPCGLTTNSFESGGAMVASAYNQSNVMVSPRRSYVPRHVMPAPPFHRGQSPCPHSSSSAFMCSLRAAHLTGVRYSATAAPALRTCAAARIRALHSSCTNSVIIQ